MVLRAILDYPTATVRRVRGIVAEGLRSAGRIEADSRGPAALSFGGPL